MNYVEKSGVLMTVASFVVVRICMIFQFLKGHSSYKPKELRLEKAVTGQQLQVIMVFLLVIN